MRDPSGSAARVAAVMAAGLLAVGCAGGRAAQARPGSGGGLAAGTTSFPAGHRQAAPQVSGTSLTGAPLRLPGGYRGKVVVLNIWASWCVPCRAEGPVLARLWRAYQPRGIQFAGVDVSDGRAQAQAFERRFGIGYPSLYDPSARAELAFGRVIPPAIPDTLVIDRNGDIAARVIGQVTHAGLRRLLSQPLEGLPQRPARRACRTRSGAGTRLGRGAAGTAQRPAPSAVSRSRPPLGCDQPGRTSARIVSISSSS